MKVIKHLIVNITWYSYNHVHAGALHAKSAGVVWVKTFSQFTETKVTGAVKSYQQVIYGATSTFCGSLLSELTLWLCTLLLSFG